MIISIDFDGTIVNEMWPRIGSMKKGAREVINRLYSEGHYIIINTLREGPYELEARLYLKRAGINYHGFNENHPDAVVKYYDSRKIGADIYIDDRNIGGIPDWETIYKIIQDKQTCHVL